MGLSKMLFLSDGTYALRMFKIKFLMKSYINQTNWKCPLFVKCIWNFSVGDSNLMTFCDDLISLLGISHPFSMIQYMLTFEFQFCLHTVNSVGISSLSMLS